MKKINVVIIILLVVSLWMNYNNKKEIEILNSDLRNNYQMMQNNINSIGSTVRNTLEDFKKESMWVQNSDYEIIKFSDDLKYADLKVSFSLKEKKNNEKLYVSAISQNSNDKRQFEVPTSDDLNYIAEITLPTENNYELQLIGETAEFTRSNMLKGAYLSRYIDSLVNINGDVLDSKYNKNKNEGYFNFIVVVNKLNNSKEFNTNFIKDLDITEIKADVYYGEEYIDTIDFINEINYTPVDIIFNNSIPEYDIASEYGEYKQQYSFSGKHEIKDVPNLPNVVMVIKVKDNKGNTYQEIIGEYYNDYWINKIENKEI